MSTQPAQLDPRSTIVAVHAAVLRAADAAGAVSRSWGAIRTREIAGPLALAAVGKAAAAMMRGVPTEALARLKAGVVVVPDGVEAALPTGEGAAQAVIVRSDHPIPTTRSVDAGRALEDLARRAARQGWTLLVLLSGGASALACLPDAGLSVEQIAGVTSRLLRAGAPIDELNTVRTHCDAIKGGGLAAAAAPSPVVTLVLSDVIGNRLDLIGSGPTAEPRTNPADALAVLKRHRLLKACPQIASHLRFRSSHPRDGTPPDRRAPEHLIVADNSSAVEAASASLKSMGIIVAETRTGITGEAGEQAFAMVGALRRHRARRQGESAAQPLALIWGGETTVTVRGSGRGGRNLEAALAAAITIEGDSSLAFATFATDGVDGTSKAAGAIVDGRTTTIARRAGADPAAMLENNDSERFFEKAGGLLTPGPTGTNLNDVWIGLAF